MPARKVSEILDADSALKELAAASRRVQQLQRIYLEAVPVALGRSSRIGWARAGVVSVIASNGAVAAKLRQLTPRILECFKRHGSEFNSMRIEVQVGGQPAPQAAEALRPLSEDALRAIEEALREVSDSPLSEALSRLARRQRRS